MVALATACLLCSVVALGADELSPDRLLAEWEASAQQIWSFDVTFELAVDSRPERSQPLAPVLRHVLRQRYLRGRWRVDDLAGGLAGSATAEPYETPEGHTNAFAMQQLVVRRYDSQQQFGSITSLPGFNETKLKSPLLTEFFRRTFSGDPYLRILEARLADASVESEGDVFVLRFGPAPQGALVSLPNAGFEVRLDRASGFMPTQIARFLPSDDPVVRVEYVSRVATVDKGVWFPVQAEKRTYAIQYSDSMDEPASVSRLIVDLTRSRFNVDIEAEVFELPFAAGTVVYDAIKKENFVQTASGDRDYLAYQRHVRDLARELATARRANGAESRQPVRWRTVLLVVHSLVFASIGVWWYRRWRASSKQTE